MGGPRAPRQLTHDERMGRTRVVALLLAGLLLAAPASAGTGSELRGIIQRTEQLRGLKTTHPIAVSTLDAARHAPRRRCASWHASGSRASDAAWDDVLHLLGVLKPGQSLEAMRRSELTGQVAGLYVPQTGRLYVLGSGGAAPRSVIAHEVTHALQDEHFRITRGAFAPRPRDHDARARRAGPRRGRRDRRPGALRRRALRRRPHRRAGAHAGLDPVGQRAAVTVPYLQRELVYPYNGGPGVREGAA